MFVSLLTLVAICTEKVKLNNTVTFENILHNDVARAEQMAAEEEQQAVCSEDEESSDEL